MKTINTGTPRNVLGHVISGAIAKKRKNGKEQTPLLIR